MRGPRFLLAALAAVLLPTLSQGTTVFEREWHWFDANVGRSVALAAAGGYVVSAGTWYGGSNYGATTAWVDSLGDTVIVRSVSGLDEDAGYLCRVSDGGYVVAGTHDSLQVFAQKFDAAGDSVWTYSSLTRGMVFAVISTADSGCLIVGRIPDSMGHFGLIKLRADGSEDWARYYSDPRVFNSTAEGAAQTKDGGFILCGYAQGYEDSYSRLVRTDSAGQQVWNQLYVGAVAPMLNDVREMPDRGFLAVGYEYDTLQQQNALYLFRTDSLGNLSWTQSFPLPGAAASAAAISATRDSGYVVAGSIDWTDSSRVWLLKLDAAADTVWTRVLPGSGIEQAADVRQTADGGYVIAGTSDSAGGSVLLAKTDSLGSTTAAITGGTPPVSERIALSVAPNPASDVVRIDCSLPGKARARLSLYDVTGKLVQNLTGSARRTLTVCSLPRGVYVLKLESEDRTATRKLVIE